MTIKKGYNSTKRDNPDLKNMCQLFFDEESIYEVAKLYLYKFCKGRTDGWTDAQTSPKQYGPSTFPDGQTHGWTS